MEILLGALTATLLILIAIAIFLLFWQKRSFRTSYESLGSLTATAAELVTAQADLRGRLSQMSEQSAAERAEREVPVRERKEIQEVLPEMTGVVCEGVCTRAGKLCKKHFRNQLIRRPSNTCF